MASFGAPREESDEIDYAAAKLSMLVVMAGAMQIFAGATMFTQGAQLWMMFVFYSWMWVLPYFLMPLGLLQMVLGATSSRGRDWAAIAGLVLTWFAQLLALAFTAWSLMQGGIIVLAFAWVGVNGVAALLAPLGVPGALAAGRVRRKLYAS